MKKPIVAWALAFCLPLSSCASMLNRSYSSVTPHVDKPITTKDSAIQVKNYSDLVFAVHYLASQGAETGIIRFEDYTGEAVGDMARACAEVATQDPVATYAVDYIRHEFTRAVSYDQAELKIRYRRTIEQVHAMVNVTGAGAIRAELQRALTEFEPEVVLRVGYFSQDETSIAEMIWQLYEEDPVTAVSYPETTIHFYPEIGNFSPETSRERVVEVLLTWPESAEIIQSKRDKLRRMADEAGASLELIQVMFQHDDTTEESRWLIHLEPGEGGSLYYNPQGEETLYTGTELKRMGYRLP